MPQESEHKMFGLNPECQSLCHIVSNPRDHASQSFGFTFALNENEWNVR